MEKKPTNPDHFGIGTAIVAVTEIYFRSARRTGRTSSLISSLKDGDHVIFADNKTADFFSRMCRERNLKIDCSVMPPEHAYRLPELGPSKGRTLFDHTWLERFYAFEIAQLNTRINYWQTEMSGFGEPHLETRRRAEEIAKWQGYAPG